MRVVAVLFFWLASTAYSQTATAPTIQAKATLILVPTEVRSRAGDLIYGLTARQFRLEDNGVVQKPRLDDSDAPPHLALAVVVQCSRDEYRDAAHMKGLATMVESLVGQSPHSIAVVSFGDEPSLVQEFTSDPTLISAALSQLQPCPEQKKNVTRDSVEYASQLLESGTTKDSRKAILLISETRDHGSHVATSDVVSELGRSNIVVESISYGPAKSQLVYELTDPSRNVVMDGQSDFTPLFAMAGEALRQNVPHTLAELTGGQYINFTTAKGFDKGFAGLTEQLHNEYRLSFQPKSPIASGLHRLSVSVPSMPEAVVRSRLVYFSEALPKADENGHDH